MPLTKATLSANGEIIDIGSRKVRYIDTPHVPHGWDAGVIFEETTQTLSVAIFSPGWVMALH